MPISNKWKGESLIWKRESLTRIGWTGSSAQLKNCNNLGVWKVVELRQVQVLFKDFHRLKGTGLDIT